MCQQTRAEKTRIRKRDAKKIKLTGVCCRCGKTARTTRHHLWYNSDHCDRSSVLEVCDECDTKIHDRDHNDNWEKELKAVRTISLKFTRDEGRYDVIVNEKLVGCAYTTNDEIKLKIND